MPKFSLNTLSVTFLNHSNQFLFRAAQFGRLEVCKQLLEFGARLDCNDKDNFTPLMMAVWKGQDEIVQFLIDKGNQLREIIARLCKLDFLRLRRVMLRRPGKANSTYRENLVSTLLQTVIFFTVLSKVDTKFFR